MNVWFSDPCLYGAVLSRFSGDRSRSKVERKFLTGIIPGKFAPGKPLHHSLYLSSARGRLSLGFLPSEVQAALSRGEALLGKPPPGIAQPPSRSQDYHKPTLASLQPEEGGVKIEIVAPPDEPERDEEEVEEADFENPEEAAVQHEEQQQAGQQHEEQQAEQQQAQQEGQNAQPAPEENADPQAHQNNMANNGVQGGQLSAIPVFSGNRGLDALTYADTIDGSIPQFGWTQEQAAQAAATRGGPAMATWLWGEKAAGITYNTWTDNDANQTPLKPAFLARFGPVYTTSGAVSAILDLKQRSTENVGSFMDRVKVAVSMLNYNVPEVDRNAAFRESYTRLVVAQFGSGISEELRGRVFGVPNPPATIEAALVAATAAEAEKSPGKMVVNVVDPPD